MSTAIVRTLPGPVDDQHRATAPIPVVQMVDHDKSDYDVRIDVSEHIDLVALIKALPLHLRISMRNGTLDDALHAAMRARKIPAVHAALTIAIDPAEAGLGAGCLAERLEEASLEPARCTYWTGDCNRFTTGEEDYCLEHLADVQEHGLPGDRGSYQGEG